MTTQFPGEPGYPNSVETDLKTIPADVLAWQALMATMQRTGTSLMLLTERDVTSEDRAEAERQIEQTIGNMDEEMRRHYFENLRISMETTNRSIENGRRYEAAFAKLVTVIGEQKGEQMKADFMEVSAYLLEQARTAGTYEPFTQITETARVAVQRMIARGVSEAEFDALNSFLQSYNLLTAEMSGIMDRHVAEVATRDEERMERVRGELAGSADTTAQ